MRTDLLLILSIYLGFALAELIWSRLFSKRGQTRNDGIVEIVSTFILLGVTQPLILLTTQAVMGAVFPQFVGILSELNIFAAIGLFLIFDDLTQYSWHRLAHSTPWLYNLHRAHHNAEYMSVRLTYRNNIFYYATMPGIWFSAVLVYLGLGWVYAGYIVIKMLVIISAHSDLEWDKPLYRIKWLSPIMWLVERTISTPATHHAHHGRHKEDGITNYKGNFGNLLFFWDVLFGTAKITRRYPVEFGVENLPETILGEQLAWPVFRASSDVIAEPAE
jgi:sterol desaturase/sphingolipid hydroxylase (fatty acid hydroxylase superfamily)